MWAGRLAYCSYLIHTTLIRAGQNALQTLFGRWAIHFPHSDGAVIFLGGLLGVAVTLALANVSWRFLEEPMLKRGQAYKY
jgi:peptidoglycan/LPS O-acetylase OafA/YrhL